jgi:hypothetical protein
MLSRDRPLPALERKGRERTVSEGKRGLFLLVDGGSSPKLRTWKKEKFLWAA